MAHHRLIFIGAFRYALRSCADDIDGEVHERRSHARCRFCDGFCRINPCYYRCVREGRHPSNSLGTFWRSALLDGLGRIPLPLLCTSLRRTARDREWRGGNKARIPYHACLVWLVDDGDDHVCVQHKERMRPDYMDTKGMFPKQAQGCGGATYDTPHEHRHVHGTQHDAVGTLFVTDVLL